MRTIAFIVACLPALAPAAHAVDVFRCTSADGSTLYQDRPCAGGQTQQTVQLPDDPVMPPASPDPAPAAAPPLEPAPEPADPAPVVPAGPAFVLCTRADGSRYISENGFVGGTGVPYGMVSGARQGLAETYGGRQGAGVSAPGLREIPRIPVGTAPFAGAQVWIADECHLAGPDEACSWLRGRLAEVGKRLEHAFTDVEPRLLEEQAALRERFAGCR